MAIAQATTIQAYQLRKGGAPARMAILRMIAADSVNNRNPNTRLQPGDWRGARHWTMKSYAAAYINELSHGFNDGESVWYCHGGAQFRNERDAQDIPGGPDHLGWFTDIECYEKAIGIVASLPHGRFIAGYRWTSNDERVYFGEVFTDETEVAQMADEHARAFAESAREDSERYEAMRIAEDDAEDKLLELQKAITLRHCARFGGFDTVRDAIAELRTARDNLADAVAAYERG